MPNLDLPAVLAEINKIRKSIGLKPIDALPIGRRNCHRGCPVALAIEGTVTRNEYRVEDGFTWEPLPEPLLEFVETFDRGLLQEFDIERKGGK